MTQGRGPLTLAMLVVVTVDATVAFVVHTKLGIDFVNGDHGWVQGLAIAGLITSAAALWLLWRVCNGYTSLRRSSRRTEAQISDVLSLSHEWIWEATPDLVFVSCSPAASELLGYRADEMVGRSAFDLVDPEFRPSMQVHHQHALMERTGWSNLYARWLHKDGSYVDTVGSAVPVLDEQGEVVGFRGARSKIPDESMDVRQTTISARVRSVIDTGDLSIALQPVVGLRDGRWCGVEALTRFADERPPEVCFAEAHQVGLGVELELVALRKATDHVALLPAGVDLAVNASADVILDPRFSPVLNRPGLDLRRLVLEITEHTAIDDYETLLLRLAPLRARGLRIAVDDTGAGYASFRHVLHLRPDVIKLDRSLLENVQDNPAARTLITAVVMLALELGASVTAEGIETAADLEAVASLGVDDAQGFYLAHPSTDALQWANWARTDWTTTVGTRVPTG